MKIATHHPERQRVAAGVDVEERLLLDRVALHAGDVAERHLELPAFVEPHLADAAQAVTDEAAVAARQAADAVALRTAQLGCPRRRVPVHHLSQSLIRYARFHQVVLLARIAVPWVMNA